MNLAIPGHGKLSVISKGVSLDQDNDSSPPKLLMKVSFRRAKLEPAVQRSIACSAGLFLAFEGSKCL